MRFSKTLLLSLCLLFIFSSSIFSQDSKKLHSVFFFGNLTDIENTTSFSQGLKAQFSKLNTPFTLVVNGDLVDEKIGETTSEAQLKKIYDLISMMESFPDGHLILIPGDRDWNKGRKGGEKSLKNLESKIKKYLAARDFTQTSWAIKKACPGPTVFEVNEGLTIITLNSQWWNHSFDKPRPADGNCKFITPTHLKEELEDIIDDNHDKNVLIFGHHPIVSLGNYGGYFSFFDQLKPFPVLGSFNTAFHANVGGKKDLANPKLKEFREDIYNLLFFHSNLIFASGHEKNQQIISGGNNYVLNSGAPTKSKYVADHERALMSKKAAGIMLLDYYKSGKVVSSFLKIDNQKQSFGKDESHVLFHSLCEINDGGKLMNNSYVPCRPKQEADLEMSSTYKGLTNVIAGKEYKANAWKKIWLGKHYRTTWNTPVQVPYLDLDHTFDGLTAFNKGGGRQTTSLKFKSRNGTRYSFRSVNKDPSKALNYKLRPTFISALLRDQTSTQQPFGAMVIAPLLDELNILHVSPKLYVLPDDKKLGPFQKKYGNLFGMLEENPGKRNYYGNYFANADEVVKSTKLFRYFYKNQKKKVDPSEFIRARLFDIWVGDWSKHEDNWKWAAFDQEDGWRIFRPIPRDRDHVFSRQDGVIPWLADRRFGIAAIENFGKKIGDIQSLTWQARHLDRFLASEISKEQFVKEAKYIQDNISSEDIENAIRKMPPEVYEKSGKEIEEKLKNRIKELDDAALKYYALLAKEVEVLGSTKDEYFVVIYEKDKVNVKIFISDGGTKTNDLLYDRIFYPKETEEIRLFGLGGDDVFDIKGNAKRSKIKVRTFGGPGDDHFKDVAGTPKTLVYDKGKGTKYELKGGGKVADHWNKELYEYDFNRFEYDRHIPLVYLGYNRFSGFGINLGALLNFKSFGKDEYQSKHRFNFGYTTEKNLTASYSGRFHQVFRDWDFQFNGSFADADFYNYFYGLGNSSVKKDSLFDEDFYKAKMRTFQFTVGAIKDFWNESAFSFSVGVERNESEILENTFLSVQNGDVFGSGLKLSSVPAQAKLDIDFRDSKGLPYRGIRALLEYQNNTILTGDNQNYGVAKGAVDYYVSSRTKNPLTLGLRGGGAISHGDEIPWYDLPTLGDRNGLRGYFENRFTGTASAFFNVELRYQLFEKHTSVVPVKVGVKVFYDRGRIYLDGSDETNEWRYGYGFGFYIVPLDEGLTVSLSASFSDEERFYPAISIGRAFR